MPAIFAWSLIIQPLGKEMGPVQSVHTNTHRNLIEFQLVLGKFEGQTFTGKTSWTSPYPVNLMQWFSWSGVQEPAAMPKHMDACVWTPSQQGSMPGHAPSKFLLNDCRWRSWRRCLVLWRKRRRGCGGQSGTYGEQSKQIKTNLRKRWKKIWICI